LLRQTESEQPDQYEIEEESPPPIAEPEPEYAVASITSNVRYFDTDFAFLPFFGKTAAGVPIDINTETEQRVLYPRRLLPGDLDDYFCLEVSGTSMTEAGINDGDMVLIKKTEEAQDGKIMLVRYDNTSTLKRILIIGSNVYLCYEDGSKQRIPVNSEEYAVQGVLVRINKLPE
jgi:SOS-response transcriptional repressor LexA